MHLWSNKIFFFGRKKCHMELCIQVNIFLISPHSSVLCRELLMTTHSIWFQRISLGGIFGDYSGMIFLQ